MDVRRITGALETEFGGKNRRIVFWYDGEREFEDVLGEIRLEGVTLLRLDETPSLELKIRLEKEDPDGRYLLYAPFYEPSPEEDWLFDIRLYSHAFHADRASLVMDEMNLANQGIRPHLKKRAAFFRNRERVSRLKKWVNPEDREDDLDLKMLAVIVRAEQPDLFSVLMKLYGAMCREGGGYDSGSPQLLEDIEKLGLGEALRDFVYRNFGYDNPDGFSLSDFIIRALVTDFANQLHDNPPPSITHFRIQNTGHATNVSVFLSRWRSHMHQYTHYNQVSGAVGEKLKIEEMVQEFSVEALVDVMTFEAVERRIIREIRDRIGRFGGGEKKTLDGFIKKRLDGYWATTYTDSATRTNLYKTVYRALETAAEFFSLAEKHANGFSFASAEKMFASYTKGLFRFDRLYRQFSELADLAEPGGWDVLKSLREKVENRYSGWFLDDLSLRWTEFLDGENGLLKKWKIPYVVNQHRFFEECVSPLLSGSSRSRVFVIISDGFRFELADELKEEINGQYRFRAGLSPMLGVLPSYTALGMAGLLPHERISFRENSSDILVDGKGAGSLEMRSEILSGWEGAAIKADDLIAMKKDQGREFVRPLRVVYIYHDQVDAAGDKAASEDRTFSAARKAVDELLALVNFIVNNLNGTRVIITADHGFVYHDKPPKPIDKSALDKSGLNIFKSHKRFILGKDLKRVESTLRGNARVTAGTETDMEFLLPRGTNRFNFSGGAKYYHGGALLQEIAVPVLQVREVRGRRLEKTEITTVGVSLIDVPKKIVTNRARFEFIQTDAVSERCRPKTLKVSIRDEGEPVSEEKQITFDSRSSDIGERKKSVSLALKPGLTFDRQKEYYLVLRNAEDDTEYDRLPLVIDIAFASDF